MTPNQMRKKAKELEAKGGNQDQINMLLDRANDEEQKSYEKSGGGYKKGGMISEYGGAEKYKSKAAEKKHEAKESPKMEKAEKAKMAKKSGRAMQAVAARAVKGHEKRMHGKKMSCGGSVSRGGGAATRGTNFKGVM